MMKQGFIFIFFLAFGFTACHDITVGYLEAENAQYAPDSMIIRVEPDPILDANRIKFEAPWVSPKIQGVIGTAPIRYRVADVRTLDTGDAEKMKEISYMDGAGVIYIPFEHNLPAGRYVFSIEIYNEGYSDIRPDIFTVWVE